VTPAWLYRRLRDQLGSVRDVYLRGDTVMARRDFAAGDEIVVLIHGFFQTRNIWEVMEDRLRFDGYKVASFNLGGLFWRFNTHPVDRTAAMIAEKIERLSGRLGFERFHIIGHSKGGLVARRYVQHYGGDRRVKSVTTLGTPHHGTPTAWVVAPLAGLGTSVSDLLPRSRLVRALHHDSFPAHIPLASVYSPEDLVCPYWCSILRPRPGEAHLTNHLVRGVGHSELVWHPGVYRILREQLDLASEAWRERTAAHTEAEAANC
jgi:triacylglycerol lipase